MGKLGPSSGSLRSFDSRPGGALGQGSSFGGGSNQLLGVLVLSNIAFNLTDMATTLFALGKGLQEGNTLVLGMSAALGLNIFSSLVILKILFMAGAVVVALIGVRSANKTGRRMAVCYLLASASLFYVVSLNNLFWILA